jgi:hypothetical protein
MTPEESFLLNRQQLIQTTIQLAERCLETQELTLAAILFTVAASAAEGSDTALAIIVGEFAKIRSEQIHTDHNKESNGPQN